MDNNGTLDLLDLDGCVVRDERGVIMATISEIDGRVFVNKTTACTVGTHLSILTYLRDLGVNAE